MTAMREFGSNKRRRRFSSRSRTCQSGGSERRAGDCRCSARRRRGSASATAKLSISKTFSQVKSITAQLEFSRKRTGAHERLLETRRHCALDLRSAQIAARRASRPTRRSAFERGRRHQSDSTRRARRSTRRGKRRHCARGGRHRADAGRIRRRKPLPTRNLCADQRLRFRKNGGFRRIYFAEYAECESRHDCPHIGFASADRRSRTIGRAGRRRTGNFACRRARIPTENLRGTVVANRAEFQRDVRERLIVEAEVENVGGLIKARTICDCQNRAVQPKPP